MKKNIQLWIKQNKKLFCLILLVIYTILFILSVVLLRINGLDYMSYIYKFNFIFISIAYIICTIALILDELDMKKISSVLTLISISVFEALFFLIISFFLILVLDIGDDSVKYIDGNYYVESDKITGGGMDEHYIEKNDCINGFLKRRK